jgi:hypothetical protein
MRTGKLILVAAVAGLFAAGWQDSSIKRERSGSTAAAKDALEGKAPPAMKFGGWLNTNGKALDWKGLRGSVILIDFWAHW